MSTPTTARTIECDVAVLGAGCAGMRAALDLARGGLSVVVLEKAKTFGGTSIVSGGIVQAAGTPLQAAMGIDDSPEKFAEMLVTAGEGRADRELVRDMCAHSANHLAFLESLGVAFDEVFSMAHLPYGDPDLVVPRIHSTSMGTKGMFETLHEATLQDGVVYEYRCEALRLTRDDSGTVNGVQACRGVGAKARPLAVSAHKGVVIATGGVDQNEPMLKRLNHQQYWDLAHYGSFSASTNTGDGVRMGIEVGAVLCNIGGSIDLSGRLLAGIHAKKQMMAAVFVDKTGQRFVCEDCTYSYVARALYQRTVQTASPCYTVFGASSLPYDSYTVASLENEVLAGTAWKGETLEELAEAIGVNASGLAHTVAVWNDSVNKGCDPAFGRVSGHAPIEPPFYAFVEGVMNLGGLGGLSIDAKARVVDCRGNAIPGLYAAGMASAGWIGPYYPGSGIALLGGLHWGWRAASTILTS